MQSVAGIGKVFLTVSKENIRDLRGEIVQRIRDESKIIGDQMEALRRYNR